MVFRSPGEEPGFTRATETCGAGVAFDCGGSKLFVEFLVLKAVLSDFGSECILDGCSLLTKTGGCLSIPIFSLV